MTTPAHRFTLGPASLTEALFTSLRERIISGDIPPGDKVTEQRVSQEYGVARPTAKACLERLTALGLLRRSAHRSATVPVMTRDEIQDLFFSRETFEAAAAAHLARQSHLTEGIVRAQTAMTQAAEREDFAGQVQSDIEFHWALITGVGSERLRRMYEVIAGEIHLTMGQFAAHRHTTPSSVAAEHDAIMASIEAGDDAAATDALSDHLRHARDRVLGELDARGADAAGDGEEV